VNHGTLAIFEMAENGEPRGNATQAEPSRLGRQYFLVGAQRTALLCLCVLLAFIVAMTYIYDHPITKLKLWKGSFPDLIVLVGLVAAWPYVLAIFICWPPRKLSVTRTLGLAAVLVLSASWVIAEIVRNVELVNSLRDMLLFTSLQALIIGVTAAFLWPEKDT
jgi:hypothetical protein